MATKAPLKSLRIKQFRGSTKDFSLAFNPGKSLTLIYGENGSGKTTICDALDFVGNGKVGSLEDRGLGPIRPFWPTVGQSQSDILVEMSIDGQTWRAQASGKSVTVTPTGVRPKVEVLRRSTILRLVQEAPSEKYEALKPFIDIAFVEQAETALRSQIKSSAGVLETAANRIAENIETLKRLHDQSGSPQSELLAWASQVIESAPDASAVETNALKAIAKTIEAVASSCKALKSARAEVTAALTILDVANNAIVEAETEAMSGDAAFEQILSAAQAHFVDHESGSVCPLCESADHVEGLARRVAERLAKLKVLTGAKKNAGDAKQDVAACQSFYDRLVEQVTTLASTAKKQVQEVSLDWTARNPQLQSALEAVPGGGELQLSHIAVFQRATEAAQQMCADMESKATWYTSVKTVYDQYHSNVASQETVSAVLPKLKFALQVCEQQRKAFLDSILTAIAAEVGRLYEGIHPGEGLNKITLKLDPKKTGSLDLAAEFLSKTEQPPHAYFSESHLDSLGLCIFLALAGRRDPERTVVVMDDVLGSIDEPHVDRLIEMVYAESSRFKHVLITTHYRPWREKFRWGWLANGQCEMMELGVWDSATGIATAALSQAPLQELRRHLAMTPPALQSACASAGVLLEAICDYLTARYECDVPRKKGKLTLGDMLPKVCEKKLSAALRVEVKQADESFNQIAVGAMLLQLRDMAQLRNIFGCHYNDLAYSLPQADALRFSQLVHDVGSAIICDTEGWPGSDKSGSYWSTRGETRRLHPLKKPS